MIDRFRRNKGVLAAVALILGAVVLVWLTSVDEATNDDSKRRKIELMYADYRKAFPEIAEISAQEAMALSDESRPVFVDVREAEEQAVSMLPGAVTEEEFLAKPEIYGDRLVIGYCTVSYRSGKLAQELGRRGIRMVNMRGGILAWLHAGGKVYKEGKPTHQVHVYGKKWDLAPSDYAAVR